MSRALGFGKGDLNPHNFLYPTLYFYVLFACEGLYFIGGRLLGAIPSRAAFQQSFFVDPTGIYLAGRALGVVCGLLTVWATWRFGRRLAGPVAGAAAALFLAVAPFAVRDAHYVKHDVPATLLITLAVMAASVSPSARLESAGGDSSSQPRRRDLRCRCTTTRCSRACRSMVGRLARVG